MKTSYILKNIYKIRGRTKMPAFLLFVLIAVAGAFNTAKAQRNNLSDWNVPPPLSPGNITKGNTTGKPGTDKQAVLILTDIPAPAQPDATAVHMPYLAMTSMPANINIPDQPVIMDVDPGLPELPLPDAPETPPLPKQFLQDTPFQSVIDLPLPDAPELPDFPAAPAPSEPTGVSKEIIPVMPKVVGLSPVSLPLGQALTPWSTPAIPENVSFRLITPVEIKGGKPRGKGAKKHR